MWTEKDNGREGTPGPSLGREAWRQRLLSGHHQHLFQSSEHAQKGLKQHAHVNVCQEQGGGNGGNRRSSVSL